MAINIGQALSGFSAGLSGRGLEFQQQQRLDRESKIKNDEIQRQHQIERSKAGYMDAMGAQQMFAKGDLKGIIDLTTNRLNMSEGLQGFDPKDTVAVQDLALLAINGDDTAKGKLGSMLDTYANTGMALFPELRPVQPAAVSPAGKVQQDIDSGRLTQAQVDSQQKPQEEVERFETVFNAAGVPVAQQSTTTGKIIANPAAKIEIDSRESAKIEESAKLEKQRAVDLTAKLIKNAEGLSKATGPISSRLPSFSESKLDFEADVEELENLLTLGNLDRMTGVLSETDIKILANAASGLSLGGSESRMLSKLKEIQARLSDNQQAGSLTPISVPTNVQEMSLDQLNQARQEAMSNANTRRNRRRN